MDDASTGLGVPGVNNSMVAGARDWSSLDSATIPSNSQRALSGWMRAVGGRRKSRKQDENKRDISLGITYSL